MFYEVIPSETFRSGGNVLTYSADMPLQPGHLVLIPLGRRTTIGVVYRQVASVDFPTKPILQLLHPLPLPQHLLSAASWLSEYYLSPLSATIKLMFPSNLPQMRKKSSVTLDLAPSVTNSPSLPTANSPLAPITTSPLPIAASRPLASTANSPLPPLSAAQRTALQDIQAVKNSTTLLHGITGSGKTNLYLHLTAQTLAAGKSTILLVPEIALTSQLVQIFRRTFGHRVILIHSQQTAASRRSIWLQILTSTEPLVVIGPRSALLAPLPQLGLILIDEAHEAAYYQENTPRYYAPRLASFIANHLHIPCILGSATPNIVDYHLAQTKQSLVTLTAKAKTTALDPTVSIIDLKDRSQFLQNRYFSNTLLTKIQNNLEQGHQTLIFHNRRGSSPLTICESCGWQALCPNCYLPMTLHADSYHLACHLCGHEETVPSCCPDCDHPRIIHKGFGTKLLETELHKLFPKANIARFDGDNSKQTSLAALYDEVKSGAVQILLGTQTLARGLDLPHLATVGIVQADAGLSLPDFTAEERTFELLTQVMGRVGRGHLDVAEVVVQTYQPDSTVIKSAVAGDFTAFAKYLLHQRRLAALPPFTYLARLSITFKTERTTLSKIRSAYQILLKSPGLIVSPPAPAFHEHTNRGFTWQIIIKATSRAKLIAALQPFSTQNGYSIILDPPSLL